MIESPVVDFPQPDSPTRPTHSPADGERDAVDRPHRARAQMELRAEVLDLENDVPVGHSRFGHGFRIFGRPIDLSLVPAAAARLTAEHGVDSRVVRQVRRTG